MTFSRKLLVATLTFWAAGPALAQNAPIERDFATIRVEGNDRFRDGDILETSGLEPGVVYSEADLVAATEALQLTGEFETVRIRSNGPVLTIAVEETPSYSGDLSFGLGYDSNVGAFGVANLTLEDALGISARVTADLLFAEEFQSLGAGVSIPNDWGPGTAIGARIGHEASSYDNTLFDLSDTWAEVFWQFGGDAGSGEVKLFTGRAEIDDVDPLASPILQAEAGSESYTGLGFSYGGAGGDASKTTWFASVNGELIGLTGDTDLGKLELTAGIQFPIGARGFSLRSEFNAGRVWGLSGDTPRAIDRFTLGGTRLRGFERGTVTPRDVCFGCGPNGGDIVTNLGGDQYATLSAELILPVFQKTENLDAFVFTDAGSAWSLDTPTPPAGTLFDERDFRSSYGLGVSYQLKGGSIEAFFAADTNKETFDEEQKFGLVSRFQF